MRRLRAICGHCHGQYANVEDNAKDHTFRVPREAYSKGISDNPPATVKFDEYRYTLRTVHTPDGTVEYLGPEDWTDGQILQRALGAF